MRKTLSLLSLVFCFAAALAQNVSVKWELGDVEHLDNAVVEGENAYASLVTPSFAKGNAISKVDALTAPNAADGYTANPYNPKFASFYVTTRTTGKTAYHSVAFGAAPQSGHKFKPTKISFDACKVGTDGGNFDVVIKPSGGTETTIASAVSPLRNRVGEGNPDGYSHHEFIVNDFIVDSKAFIVILYIYNINGVDNENPKSIALRNVMIEGAVDEEIFDASHYVASMDFNGVESFGEGAKNVSLTSLVKSLKNGETASYPNKLYGAPTDFNVVCKDGYTAQVSYENSMATVSIYEGSAKVFSYKVRFTVTNKQPKPKATPLKRGLMAVSLSGAGMGTGNLVSWRIRETDPQGIQFKLYSGTNDNPSSALNSGKFITGKSNFAHTSGNTATRYKLEVYDADGNLLETEVSGKTWANQTMTIPTKVPAKSVNGAEYFPNDASFCDMDGDGEYEIILKWSPSDEKDAASSGTTSDPIIDCYKLDGTQLWRINLGHNFFTSAHTIMFIAWDLDGDGYGELVCKTAPGTIDGEGNYVLLGNDNPNDNLLSGRGKQDHGSEYLTVFDGCTGAEISTIPYHTDYQTGASYWGDDKQNRSERYTACLAYLDGEDQNPSAIFNRGYYSGAFVGAYDFDGEKLTERWVSRNISSGKGLWGEGAHWLTAADLDGDGKHEIQFGSAALDHDGSLLYRTGMGHGDAVHIGDFLTDRPGLEVFMCHEKSPYGVDLRDAKTGEILVRQTAGGDTGRGLAAHFDSTQKSAQFLTSASASMYNCEGGTVNGESWTIGSSGAGINCRIYWDGDLFDEFFDKSIIAHWNPTNKSFDRYKFNNGNYLWGNLNNGSKNNPCVMGDILGDWREEIVTWDDTNKSLIICATSYTSNYPVPHLMDNIQYRENVVSQNVGYNQPPHLSYDPAVRFGVIDPFAPVEYKKSLAEGSYYIRNVEAGAYLLGGQSWGTRAIAGDHGIDFKATLVGDYIYNLDSQISNGGANHYLSVDAEPYVDAAPMPITIKKVGTYYTISNGTSYLTLNDDMTVSYSASSTTSTKSRWQFVTREQMIADLSKATSENPIDATFLMDDPNFGRNDQRYPSWAWSSDCTNKNNSGDETNFCVESYHSTFTFSQELKGVPNGYYTLKAQGFYRVDGSDETAPAVFANGESTPLPILAGAENSMKDASASFSEGKYETDPVIVKVEDGTLTVGVKNESNKEIWAIWDNFTLTYTGASDPTGIANVERDKWINSGIYTLQGVKISKALAPGVYIMNGKKVFVK